MNIKVENLNKSFTEFSLKNISLTIPKGKIVGLIGENGAGKTTLLKCLLKIMNIDSGNITFFNEPWNDSLKESIGVVFDNSFVNEKYNVCDINLIMKRVHKNWDEALFFDYMKKYQIPLKKEIKKLSTGMKKKIEIAVSLSYHPKILILDEPTSGLDPVIRSEILEMFQNFIANQENSILLSTHITSDLESIADEVIFISNGEIVFDKSLKSIHEEFAVLMLPKDRLSVVNPIKYLEVKNHYLVLIGSKEINADLKGYVKGITALDDIMLLYIRGQ